MRRKRTRCECFIGTARRECLDWMIPLNERHLRSVLVEWISHYNGEQPHSALGPGLPDNSKRRTTLAGHRLPAAHRVVGSARLGGLHHHYELEPIAALVLQESFEPEIVHPVIQVERRRDNSSRTGPYRKYLFSSGFALGRHGGAKSLRTYQRTVATPADVRMREGACRSR